jgi:ribonucrease Y
MILLANIFEGAALFSAGAVICFLLLWWRERSLQKAKLLESQALLDKARNEAEIIKRDASAAASQEALKLREQIEESFAARRAERAESERRLGEREALINSQLQQMMEAEKALTGKKNTLETQLAGLEAGKREAAELKTRAREELQKLAGLT